MQFIKHVEPKFMRPRSPIVDNAVACRLLGCCNNKSKFTSFKVHGLHDKPLFRLLKNTPQYTFKLICFA